MEGFDDKRISDPVHGSIGLSNLEARVIDTRAFQRLRNVKHLGLANLVYPSADFSRFSHSIGACHVVGRTLEALRSGDRTGSVDHSEAQLYRLAALLHDVGHYPFSHAMEQVVQDFYSSHWVVSEGDEESSPEPNLEDSRTFRHERAGKQVLLSDSQLREEIELAGFGPEEISSIFMRERPPKFANLLSSDLDADRIDYLLRTAHHTGLPYGNVDLDYILSQLRVDGSGNICLSTKALRAADHFLLSRYFDYQQVAYHKTVAAFELVLKDVLQALLEAKLIECSASSITRSIRNGEWYSFDDQQIHLKLVELHDSADDVLKLKIDSIRLRRPPKLVWTHEFLDKRSDGTRRSLSDQRRILVTTKDRAAEKFGIDPRLWFIWLQTGLEITKVGGHIPVSRGMQPNEDDQERFEQSLRMIDVQTGSVVPIMEMEESLMSILSDFALHALRLYVILPSIVIEQRGEIEMFVRGEMESGN